MRGIGIDAINAPRRNDANIRHAFQMPVLRHMRLHVANLDRRSMRAQHVLLVDIKSVVHGTRRMILRDIQRGKIVEIVFDLRACRNIKADRVKQCLDAFQGARDRMQSAHARAAPGQRHIQRFRRQFGLQRLLAAMASRRACSAASICCLT